MGFIVVYSGSLTVCIRLHPRGYKRDGDESRQERYRKPLVPMLSVGNPKRDTELSAGQVPTVAVEGNVVFECPMKAG